MSAWHNLSFVTLCLTIYLMRKLFGLLDGLSIWNLEFRKLHAYAKL